MGRAPGKRPTTIKRHNMIRRRFDELSKKTTSKGQQKYTFAGKIEILEREFGYSPFTIETIISQPMEADLTLTLF